MTTELECTCVYWWIDPVTGYHYAAEALGREARVTIDADCPAHTITRALGSTVRRDRRASTR